jgi:hypothetical protein
LLDPIARNKNVSTVPIIETIDDSTLEMKGVAIDDIQVGGFGWNLIFQWFYSARSIKSREHKTDPIKSPTMAGKFNFIVIGINRVVI